MTVFRNKWGALLVLLTACVHGCVYTVAGAKLPPIAPPAPRVKPSVEQTVGDFSFTLEGGKMITSNFQGKQLNGEILTSWKDRGYIRDEKYVEEGAFSGAADYDVTLNGTQYGESSILLQILSGLTLFLLPYSVTQNYDLQYAVQDVKTGKVYNAGVQETETTYVELFLLFALPFGLRGHNDTIQRMGDHLYEQVRTQGAFQSDRVIAPAAP